MTDWLFNKASERHLYVKTHLPQMYLNSHGIPIPYNYNDLFSYVFCILFKMWTAPLKDRHTQNKEATWCV